MAHVRELRRGPHVYYELVESYRDEEGRGHTRVLRYLGKHKTPPPDPVELSGLHFGVLAFQLMEGALTPEGVFDLLDTIGKRPASTPDLEAIGIRFDFSQKKLSLHFYARSPGKARPSVPRAAKRRGGNAPARGAA